uniref:Uncharacterized protein n=1 Tax=Schistocephalus solidus TaxID=70667 RepID=A0A0X3NHG6_SCHSO
MQKQLLVLALFSLGIILLVICAVLRMCIASGNIRSDHSGGFGLGFLLRWHIVTLPVLVHILLISLFVLLGQGLVLRFVRAVFPPTPQFFRNVSDLPVRVFLFNFASELITEEEERRPGTFWLSGILRSLPFLAFLNTLRRHVVNHFTVKTLFIEGRHVLKTFLLLRCHNLPTFGAFFREVTKYNVFTRMFPFVFFPNHLNEAGVGRHGPFWSVFVFQYTTHR